MYTGQGPLPGGDRCAAPLDQIRTPAACALPQITTPKHAILNNRASYHALFTFLPLPNCSLLLCSDSVTAGRHLVRSHQQRAGASGRRGSAPSGFSTPESCLAASSDWGNSRCIRPVRVVRRYCPTHRRTSTSPERPGIAEDLSHGDVEAYQETAAEHLRPVTDLACYWS